MLKSSAFLLGKFMYKTKRFGVVSSKIENQILADLERDLKRKRRKAKHEPVRHDKDTSTDN